MWYMYVHVHHVGVGAPTAVLVCKMIYKQVYVVHAHVGVLYLGTARVGTLQEAESSSSRFTCCSAEYAAA